MFLITKPDVAEGEGFAVGLESWGAAAEHPVNKSTVAAVMANFPQGMTKVYRWRLSTDGLDQLCERCFAHQELEAGQRDCNRDEEGDARGGECRQAQVGEHAQRQKDNRQMHEIDPVAGAREVGPGAAASFDQAQENADNAEGEVEACDDREQLGNRPDILRHLKREGNL